MLLLREKFFKLCNLSSQIKKKQTTKIQSNHNFHDIKDFRIKLHLRSFTGGENNPAFIVPLVSPRP